MKETPGRSRCRWEENTNTNFKEMRLDLWTTFIGSGEGPMAGFCEHGNDHSISRKDGYLLDRLS
jgi:hypothetical protein